MVFGGFLGPAQELLCKLFIKIQIVDLFLIKFEETFVSKSGHPCFEIPFPVSKVSGIGLEGPPDERFSDSFPLGKLHEMGPKTDEMESRQRSERVYVVGIGLYITTP